MWFDKVPICSSVIFAQFHLPAQKAFGTLDKGQKWYKNGSHPHSCESCFYLPFALHWVTETIFVYIFKSSTCVLGQSASWEQPGWGALKDGPSRSLLHQVERPGFLKCLNPISAPD